MKRVSADIVAQRLPEILAEVLAGEEIELTRDGESIARLVRMPPSLPAAEATPPPSARLSNDPAIGMWADHDDLRDAAHWVARQRVVQWTRGK